MSVCLVNAIGALGDIPVHAAIHVLDGAHLDGFFLVVAQLDFERFIDPVLIDINPVVGLAALANDVECVAGKDAQRLIGWGVADQVLAGKLELSVVITTIETHATLGQRHSHIIGPGILDLLHNPDRRIRFGSVTAIITDLIIVVIAVAIGIDLCAIVYINTQRLDA